MRKTIVLTGAALLLAASLLLLTGCSSPVQSREDPTATRTGTVTLTIGQNLARTILPDVEADDFDRFYLTFTRVDAAGTYSPAAPWTTDTGSVTLPFGTWNLHVYAYLTSTCADPSAEGTSDNFPLGAGNLTATVSVALEPISDPDAEDGTFAWTVDISGIEGAGLTSANIAIVNLDGNAAVGTHPLAGPSTHLLGPGQYRVTLTIVHAEYGTLILSEILHVFSNLTSTWELGAITSADFTEELSAVVIRSLGNLTGAGISDVHFGLLGITLTAPQFTIVNARAPELNIALPPTTVAELGVLVGAALVTDLATGAILTALPTDRAGLFGDLLPLPGAVPTSIGAAVWTDPTVTVRVGEVAGFGYDVTFTFNLPDVTVSADGASLVVDSDLTANTTAITDVIAGLGGFFFAWQRSGTPAVEVSWTAITATLSTYTLASADVGQYIRVLVSHPSFVGTRTSAERGPVADLVTTGTVTVNITLDFSDEAADAYITLPTAAVILANAPATWPSISVDDTYFDSVRWRHGNTETAGATLALGTAVHGNRVGTHFITLEVVVNGSVYSRRVTFDVLLSAP